MKRFNIWEAILRSAEDGNGGAPAAAAAEGQAADPGSVLFPNEGAAKPGDGKQDEQAQAPAAGDWKEYEADPNKSDEENAAAKDEHDKAKPADPNAPENQVPADGKYDLKMPDGVELDAELASALGPEFSELKLTNAQAQKLVDKYTAIQQERAGKQSTEWAARISGWVDEAKKDPEIGGVKWDATAASAQRAVKALGTPALGEYLNASGGGNHPELIRFMAKVGAMIKEDTPATGGAEGSGKPADPSHIMFPSDTPKG